MKPCVKRAGLALLICGAGTLTGDHAVGSNFLSERGSDRAFSPGVSFSAIRDASLPSEGALLDRHGEMIHELRVDMTHRRAAWVPLAAISPKLLDTVVRIEDHRFYTHRGVDWLALGGAAWRGATGGTARGASTISMQLAALLDPALPSHRGGRSLRQKWAQLRAAQRLEARWRKDEILETYLNLASYRGEIQGIGAASRALLDRAPAGIDAVEALLLTTLLRSPNAAAAAVAARGCRLSTALRLAVPCQALAERTAAALAPDRVLRPQVALAPHAARHLLRRDLREVTSTLDLNLQRQATDALQRQLSALRDRNVQDGAVLAVDNARGEILAYVGNGGPHASARYVDGVIARRQAGSTLKPFLYQLAIEQRLLTAASLLDDSPLNLSTPTGLYVPQNYDRRYQGMVSVRRSLSGSLNVPAVRSLMLVGADGLVERLRGLGFSHIDRPGDYYGYALALGSAEVSLWQLVNAYRALANGGFGAPLTFTEQGKKTESWRLTPSSPFFQAAFIVGDILADRVSRSLSFGLESPLATPFWSAVKTGTSKHMRDNWCIGYSQRYTVGVWVGNFDGQPMWDVSGLTGAAPVWFELMRYLHAADGGAPPPPPAGVQLSEVNFDPALEAPRREWFIAGTEQRTVAPKRDTAAAPRITYPGRDSILVIDPDIPPQYQRVFFAMAPAHAAARWLLDGRGLPPGQSAAWQPEPGTHKLSLVSPDRRTLDELTFHVRGTWPRSAGR